jgi:hypothetical protein
MRRTGLGGALLVSAVILTAAFQGHAARPLSEPPAKTAEERLLWLLPDDKGSTVQVFFNELPSASILPGIEKGVVLVRDANGTESVKCRKSDDKKSYVAEVPGKGIRWLGAEATPEVVQPPGKKPFLLRCYGAALIGYTPHLDAMTDAPKMVSTPWNRFPLEMVVTDKVALIVRVYWRGKPLPDPKVTYRALNWKGWSNMHVAGKTPGEVYDQVPQGNAGIFALRVTHIESAEGEYGGKKYEEVHHRATLVLRVVDSDRRKPRE